MTDTFVVIWRPTTRRRRRWEVQPHIMDGATAAKVGGQLVDQFGGEAWALPIVIPPAEDSTDLEEGR